MHSSAQKVQVSGNLLTAQDTLDKSKYEPRMAFEVVRKRFGYLTSKNYFTRVFFLVFSDIKHKYKGKECLN